MGLVHPLGSIPMPDRDTPDNHSEWKQSRNVDSSPNNTNSTVYYYILSTDRKFDSA
jgi:hypothetical protein